MCEGARSREHIKQNLVADVLRRTGRVQLIAFGYSMLPSVWPGDQLTIETRAFDEVQREDVVVYARSRRLFIHRALWVAENRIVTRGDAMPSADAPVQPEELMGIVTAIRQVDGNNKPVPVSSCARRLIGLALTYSGRLRSLALRWRVARMTKVPAVTQQGSGVSRSRLACLKLKRD